MNNCKNKSLLDQIIVGAAPSLTNLIIHAVLLAVVVRTVRELSKRGQAAPAVLTDILIIVATGVLLVAGHFVEVLVWAGTYAIVGAAPPGTDLVYFAFSNYTTLGYGDVHARGGLAPARADDGTERHSADRLVDGADLRHHQARVAGRSGAVSAQPRLFRPRSWRVLVLAVLALAVLALAAARFRALARAALACSSPYFMPSSLMPSGSRKNTA